MCVRVCFARVCAFVCICIGQTSSIRLRIQSSPDVTDSHFLRWLTAVHVNNNNICSAFISLRNNFSITVLRKTEMTDLLLFFEFFKSTVEWMNERILQLISPPSKLKSQALRCVLRRLTVISTLGDDHLLKMRAIIPLLVKWELGVFLHK